MSSTSQERPRGQAHSDGKAEASNLRKLSERLFELSEVLVDLYVSGERAASNSQLLQKTGISHIVNVAAEISDYYPNFFTYLHIPARDSLNERMGPHFRKIAAFVQDARKSSAAAKVLIHCHEGVSRSATAVLACLMINEGMRLGEALEFLKSKRRMVEPNTTFLMELRVLEQELFGAFTARKLSFLDPGVDQSSGLVIKDWRQSLRNILGSAGSDENYVVETNSGEARLLWRAMRLEDPDSIGDEGGVLEEIIREGFEMFGGSDERDGCARRRLADVLQEGYTKRQQVTESQLHKGLDTIFQSDDFADLRFDVPLANRWAEELLNNLTLTKGFKMS